MSLILFDIDHLKWVNDSWGREAGDRVLKSTSQQVRSLLPKGAIFCRYGGEEFALLCPGIAPKGALGLASDLRSAIAIQSYATDRGAFQITASFGVTGFEAGGDLDIEHLLAEAEDAVYAAKETGRDRVVLHGRHQATTAGKERSPSREA